MAADVAADVADPNARPVILITGASGQLGRSLAALFASDYRVIGLDRAASDRTGFPTIAVDLASGPSVELALHKVREEVGARIASVLHLVAYFDFSGEDHPAYDAVNVEGTRRLLAGLRAFEVEQFVHASTVLVHAPCKPGGRIDETSPVAPRWAYPLSKAKAEEVVRTEHGSIPCAILRLAGVYDRDSMVPTLARQIARVHSRDLESYFYAGNPDVGQAMVHRLDMLDAFRRTVDARHRLPPETTLLIGEPDAMGYDAIQDVVGTLLHGVDDWPTLRLPKAVAAAGAYAKARLEPLVPDAIDGGKAPFVRPFMVELADDHYALDVRRARALIGWEPQHRLADELPAMVAALQAEPKRWYERHGIPVPAWLEASGGEGSGPERLRLRHEQQRKREHAENRWAPMVNMGLGTWLLTQPPVIGVREPSLALVEVVLGALLLVCAAFALSWRATWARWACAAIGAAVMAAPFVFWTVNPAAYLSDTLIGALVFALAVVFKPEPGSAAVAALRGPEVPSGWSYNPSGWAQRMPIVVLALVGLYVSRYLAGYQLGHLPTVWEPFFPGSAADPRNGTEEIITSHVSEAWPFPDAAIGGWVYMLEILTGVIGSTRRWRTMPWMVVLFGLLIAPLGITSIVFIIIQPVVLGTWSTLALIAAAAMLVQIPYSLDELLATVQFLRRRAKRGQSIVRIFFVGDTDEGRDSPKATRDEFAQSPKAFLREALSGGVGLPWTLALTGAIGLALMFSRVTLGATGELADIHHVIGAVVLTVVSIAAAEVARPARWLNVPLGLALAVLGGLASDAALQLAVSVVAGVAIAALSVRRGPVRERYGAWTRLVA